MDHISLKKKTNTQHTHKPCYIIIFSYSALITKTKITTMKEIEYFT